MNRSRNLPAVRYYRVDLIVSGIARRMIYTSLWYAKAHIPAHQTKYACRSYLFCLLLISKRYWSVFLRKYDSDTDEIKIC